MFNMVYTEAQIDAIPANVFIKMLEDQKRMMRVMLRQGAQFESNENVDESLLGQEPRDQGERNVRDD